MKVLQHEKDPTTRSQEPEPSLFAWIASMATILLILSTEWLPSRQIKPMMVLGIVLFPVAALFIFTPLFLRSKLQKNLSGSASQPAAAFCQDGFYGLLRHPQYLGYILLGSGFTLLSPHWLTAGLLLVASASFFKQSKKEEMYCTHRYGTAYQEYCQKVPMFNIISGLLRKGVKND